MIEAVKKVAESDYSVSLDVSEKHDDIDLLADAINKMVGHAHQQLSKAKRNEDAAKFRYLHETMMDAFASCDMTGYIQEANRSFEALLGYSEDELRKKTFRDLTPEKWHALEARFVEEQVMARGYSEVYEKEYRKKDGTILPVELRTFLVRDSAGRPIGTWAIVRDIAERKRAVKALRMFKFAVEEAPDAVFFMSRDGGFPYVNEQACRSLGFTREEFMDLRLWDIDPFFPKERMEEEWKQYQKGGQIGSQHIETWHRRKDGVVFPVEVAAKHIWFGNDELHVAFVRDITERKRAEEALDLFRFSIDRASDAVFWLDCDGSFPYINEQVCRYLGYTHDEMMRLHVWDIAPNLQKDRWPEQWEDVKRVGKSTFETVHRHKDGNFIPVEISANHIKFGDQAFHIAFVRDITERKREEEEKAKLESQLIQAQKMESVGRLAGGVAHDFNNMLSVILGYAELINSQLSNDDPLRAHLSEIEKAAKRSRDTTRQLLAFSRKQIISPRPMNLNDLIMETQKALARLIGEHIDLRFYPEKEPCHISFDPSQIDQILINLAVNARDAMPNGGKLTVETKNVHLDEGYCRKHPGAIPGSYVMLSVSDDGLGMDKKTLSHVFEPFFTTKEVGKGTGLGLATVYGIVKQNGGFIYVYSEPGQGSTFKIYLPGSMKEDEFTGEVDETPFVHHVTGTILLVEDDDMVRRMTEAMLNAIGYTVLVAETPLDAQSISEKEEAPIDLLITDVVMPGMSGPELSDKVKVARPGIKVLFMSGYTSNVIADQGILGEGVHFIQKPFGKNDLARKIHEVIGDK